MIDLVEQRFLIVRHELEVIKRLESVDLFRRWVGLRIVIYEPSCDVRVETLRYGIK